MTVIPELMRYCMKLATRYGVSFGYLELAHLAAHRPPVAVTTSTEPNQAQNEQVNGIVKAVATEWQSGSALGFALLAHSGARGGAEQTRQVVLQRGTLAAGEVGFNSADGQYDHAHSLVDGMSADERFWSAFNGRSSMIDKKLGTPQAGYLTRQLVLAAWGWRVVEVEHCGTEAEAGSVLACKLHTEQPHRRICRHCYGEPLNGEIKHYPYPAGLIAAQSFGERGTQLSMQSFHTGKKAISLGGVQALVSAVRSLQLERYEDFVQALDHPDYRKLDPRHLKLIWLALRRLGESDPPDLDQQLVGYPQQFNRLEAAGEQPLAESPLLQLLTANWREA